MLMQETPHGNEMPLDTWNPNSYGAEMYIHLYYLFPICFYILAVGIPFSISP